MEAQDAVVEAIEAVDSSGVVAWMLHKMEGVPDWMFFIGLVTLIGLWLWRRRRKT